MEPPPKQGCELAKCMSDYVARFVSVEPPPKQGCEKKEEDDMNHLSTSQWNPRRSRGASIHVRDYGCCATSLSGTPAEAGVRVVGFFMNSPDDDVSVEPPPKQGCEPTASGSPEGSRRSQWNPRRSRGASIDRPGWGIDIKVSVEPPPKQGCEYVSRTY